MNIIPNINKDKLSREQIEYLQQQQKEFKPIGTQRKIPGHTLFSYNMETGEIKKAEIKREAVINFNRDCDYIESVVVEPNCFYEQALNIKSFAKRINKYGTFRKERKYIKLLK